MLFMSKGYIDCYIEISERMVTKKLVNSGDFHIPHNVLDLKYNNKHVSFLQK